MEVSNARAVSNWRKRLYCDWCGAADDPLYAPERFTGVFCATCVVDVLNPPPAKPVRVWGELPVEDDMAVQRKLDAYLRTRPAPPTFCGRGRPRKEKAPEPPPKPHIISRWKFFERGDTLRIVRQKPFAGNIGKVLACVTDGATVGEVLERAGGVGVDESRAVTRLRKLVRTYHVLAVDRAA
jgi:hypothetical protein